MCWLLADKLAQHIGKPGELTVFRGRHDHTDFEELKSKRGEMKSPRLTPQTDACRLAMVPMMCNHAEERWLTRLVGMVIMLEWHCRVTVADRDV